MAEAKIGIGEALVDMSNTMKMNGEERRKYIIHILKKNSAPVTGTALAAQTKVSRQVIVQDISLLKAGNEPIIATNRGYLLMQERGAGSLFKRVIAVNHSPEDTEAELQIIVDAGVTVVDVTVEHSFYGELTGSLMISSRYDVEQFVQGFTKENAALLSVLTGGVHLHALEADAIEKLDRACAGLEQAGFLLVGDEEF